MNMRIILYIFVLHILPIQALYKEPVTTREQFTFTIKLASAPLTGLDWFFGNEKELNEYVQLAIPPEFVPNPSISSGRIGKKVFTFKALKAGKIKIKMVKRKSWEDKEADHVWIKVHIKKADLN